MRKLILLLILLIVMVNYSYAQEMVFTFITKDASAIDSIIGTNIVTGGSKTVQNTNIIDLTEIASDAQTIDRNSEKMWVYPNPFQNTTELQLAWNKNEEIELYLMNSLGQVLVKGKQHITSGSHKFKISTNSAGLFFIVVSGKNRQFSKKIMATGKGIQSGKIEYLGFNPEHVQKKSAFVENEDLIHFSIYSGDRITKISDTPKESKTYSVEFIECKDSDGKNYPIVKIGEQWWMAENMAYIPKINTISDYSEGGERFYVFGYEGNDLDEAKAGENYDKYGVLYNWEAALKTCPSGWYMANKDEWQQLAKFISNDNGGYEKVVDNWQNVGKHLLVGVSDDYGFSAIGGGMFNEQGSESIEEKNFWTSSQVSSEKPIYFNPDEYYLYQNNTNPFNGFSVRCINRNSTAAIISLPLVNTNQTILMYATSAKGGGVVYDDGGAEIISRGMCWNTTGMPTVLDNKTTDSTGIGPFSSNLLSLEPNTRYFSRAYATNSKGTSYGQEILFTTQTTESKLATILDVTSDAAKIFQDTFYTFNDTLRALHAVGNFLADNEAVESAFYITSDLIDINFTNGLSGAINLIEVDENGNHLTRGGKSTGALTAFSMSGSTTKIKNEKVLVLNPYLAYFPYPGGSYDSYLPFFKGGDVELEVTHIDNKNVRLSDINSMDEYGLVILNTHGKPNSFSFFDVVTKTEPWNEEWTSALVHDLILQAEGLPTALFESGELELGTSFLIKNNEPSIDLSISFEVTEDYIRNSDLDLTDVIVFGNHCYSGFAHPYSAGHNMVEAWQNKNVATYYGYAFDNLISRPVQDTFCQQVEATLIKRLAQDNDTTGIAHLSSTDMLQSYDIKVSPNIVGLDVYVLNDYQKFSRAVSRGGGNTPIPFYFMKFFSGSYKWGCPDTLLDARDMQVYKTVCIGDQTWMAENLNFASPNSTCFLNDPSICEAFGRLYDYFDVFAGDKPVGRYDDVGVKGICPKGWHIPSHKEWMKLEQAFGMPESELDLISGVEAYNRGALANVGNKLKSDVNWLTPPIPGVTNESRLSLKPGGFHGSADFFNGAGLVGYYWTSSNGVVTADNSPVLHRILHDDLAGISIGYQNIYASTTSTYSWSCRCVKDKEEE